MDNALALVQQWIVESSQKVMVIPRSDRNDGCEELLGISEHSVLGTIINHTGGISVANGKIRHLGGNNRFGISLAEVNNIKNMKPNRFDGFLVVSTDIYGGVFGINFNPSISQPGNMVYLPPEAYQLFIMQVGHSDFVKWSMSKKVDCFYRDLDSLPQLSNVPFDQVVSYTPPLWSTNLQNAAYITKLLPLSKWISIRSGMLDVLS